MKQRLNFNVLENQSIYEFRAYPEVEYPIKYGNVVLQFFIYSRNYGWTQYKDVVYNLNQQEEALKFIHVLKEEGFLTEAYDRYTIHDKKYIGFNGIPYHHLLYFLYFTKGKPFVKS